MAREIKLQKLGENLDEGKVLDVKVALGAAVAKDQPLLEIEAEKAAVEILAPQAGQVAKILVNKGDKVTVGQTLCVLEDGADGQSAAAKAAPQRVAAAPPPAQTAPSPPASLGQAERGAPSPLAGEGRGEGPSRPSPAPQPIAADKPVPAGPATRRLARELGIDLQQVSGTALGGRITQEDVKGYVRRLAGGTVVGGGAAAAAPPLPDFERWGPVERQPLEQVRRRTAEHLSMAWNQIPHVTQHDQCDITELDAFRRSQEGSGPKLTVTAFAIKAAAIALQELPQFNSSIDLAGGQLILKRFYNVGIAVDTERGLLVPVIRDVERKSVHELAAELGDIAQRARARKLAVDDMRGSTFTITNLGGIGGTAFTPIVNWPDVAILGMSRGRLQPTIRDAQVVPRLILPLSLSYDHRVIDGAAGARFARRIAELLENPLKMLLFA